MADFWQIKGEAGKAMDATLRDFKDVGELASASFPALATDTFNYVVTLDTLDGAGEIIPDDLQQVTVYRNGTRFFFGPARVRQYGNQAQVTILGAWFWLEKAMLSTIQTDSAANSAERMSFAFAMQSSEISLTALLNRLIVLGTPIGIGTLEVGFTWPEITINQSNGDIAVAELIRLIPDMMAWFDYSGTGPVPLFNTSRRSTATVRTLNVADLGEDFSVEPVLQLKVEFVRVPYVGRAVNGGRIYQEMLSGDAGTAQAGSTTTTLKLRAAASFSNDAYKNLPVSIISGTGAGQTRTITGYVGATKVATVNTAWVTIPNNTSVYKVGEGLPSGVGTTHMLTVSGEELDTFLPDELFETYFLKTSSEFAPILNNLDGEIVSARQLAPGLEIPVGGAYSYYSRSQGNYATNPGTAEWYNATPATIVDLTGNGFGSVVGLVLGEDPPEWVKKDLGLNFTKVKIKGQGLYEFNAGYESFIGGSWVMNLNSPPAWMSRVSLTAVAAGFRGHQHYKLLSHPFEAEAWAVNFSSPAGVLKYKPADFGFRFPPPGFAANLQAAQNFTPYTGSFSLEEEEAGGTRFRGCVVNITGGLPKLATMLAMVAGEDLDIESGRTTVSLGAPQRMDYRSTIDKVRRTSQDNIYYLT